MVVDAVDAVIVMFIIAFNNINRHLMGKKIENYVLDNMIGEG